MVDPSWDVALITIDAQGLAPVAYAPTSAVPQGTWIVANGATSRKNRRALAGIVSANSREILPEGGAVLGVVLDSKSKKLRIADVDANSGAKEAGLAEGDVILALDGEKVKNIQAVAEFLKDRRAGTMVTLTSQRGQARMTADVRLSARGQVFKGKEELSRNDQMSGEYSLRRSGFPRILEHDILGNRSTAGGPLIDLEGRCLGMNIARANRAESFAIPVEELREIAARMMKQAGR
jgi:serine protease Do